MQIFALFWACLICVTVGWIALAASLVLGRGKQQSGWLHLLRAAGAAAGCFAGLCGAVVAAVFVGVFATSLDRSAQIPITIGLLACPVLGAVAGAVLARPILRLAYVFTRWLAREVGLVEAA